MRTVPCKGCGKPIVWATLREGGAVTSRRIPLDMAPPVYALVPLLGDAPADLGGAPFCERIGRIGGAIEVGVNHFVTCPQANDFSKGAKKP